MGAETFKTHASGRTADEAFRAAVIKAQYDHGHSGYTGTIAEKDSFIMIVATPEQLDNFNSEAWQLVDDKWGPAGCVDLGEEQFLFFGWASS